MKNKLLKTIFFAVFSVIMATGLVSCSKDDDRANMTNLFYTVEQQDWVWDADNGWYSFTFSDRRINNQFFDLREDGGAVNGYVYIILTDQSGSFEVLKNMPYIQTYPGVGGAPAYTETISFDISPGFIAFYIQSSDLNQANTIPTTYTFKVTLFYRP